MEIGIDIEQNDRFKEMSEKYLREIFSSHEIEYAQKYQNYFEHLCAFWCVKESFVKATKNQKIEFVKIEVSHNEDGSPFIIMNKEIKQTINQLGLSEIKISISHCKKYSTAICLIY